MYDSYILIKIYEFLARSIPYICVKINSFIQKKFYSYILCAKNIEKYKNIKYNKIKTGTVHD